MNFCPKCGTRLRPGARFCIECGNAVGGAAKDASGNAGSSVRYDAVSADESLSYGPVTDETVVPKSKRKLVELLLGCLAAVGTSFVVIALDPGASDWRTNAAPLGILFFGAGVVVSLAMLFKKKPGMVLNSQGFEFLAQVSSPGLIRWRDVAGYRVDTILCQTMLLVLLKDPEGYCREHGVAARLNMKSCGSPVAIPESNSLAMDFPSLVTLFGRYFAKYGSGRG